MPIRLVAVAVAPAHVLAACDGSPERAEADATSSERAASVTSDPAVASPSATPLPPRADEIAAAEPIDLIVDLGPEGWTATYNDGAGIEVTEDNWAEAYEVTDEQVRDEIAAAKESGERAAATEQWRLEPEGPSAGYSNLRLTIRQYESRRGLRSVEWIAEAAKAGAPDGIAAPDDMRVGCREATDASDSGAPYDGAYYADCAVIVAGTTAVYLSSIAPDAGAATDGAVDGIAEWLDAVTAA